MPLVTKSRTHTPVPLSAALLWTDTKDHDRGLTCLSERDVNIKGKDIKWMSRVDSFAVVMKQMNAPMC